MNDRIDCNMDYLNPMYFFPNTDECNGENECGCSSCDNVRNCDSQADRANNGGCMPWE